MRKLHFAVLAVAMLLPATALAAEMRGGETVSIDGGIVIEENLYIGGGNVTVDGNVLGDAYMGGGNITVSGTVSDDLVVGGGSVILVGPVEGDLRVAGGSVTVGNSVGGEMIAAGGQVSALPSASALGDAFFAGGSVSIKGTYGGNVEVYADDVRIDAVIEGNLVTHAERARLAPGAVIKGAFVHEGPVEAVMETGATVSGPSTFAYKASPSGPADGGRVPWEAFTRALGWLFLAFVLVKYLAFVLASVAATLWLTGRSKTMVERTMGNFGTDLLTGFVTLVVAPVAAILAFSSLVGTLVACIAVTALVLAGMIAAVYACVSFGALVRSLAGKRKTYAADWKSALLGTTLLMLVMAVPVVGWLFGFVFWAANLGSVLRLGYDGLVKHR